MFKSKSTEKPSCAVDGCEKPQLAKGFCRVHYPRFLRHGDPLAGRQRNGSHKKWLDQNAVPSREENCVLWPFSRDAKGYARIHSRGLAHRYVCEKVNGPPPNAFSHSAHTCGKGSSGCVSGNHVMWKTPKENEADKKVHGTNSQGERHGRSKLTEADVRAIREINGALSNRQLALVFGVSPACISRAKTGVDWGWLE